MVRRLFERLLNDPRRARWALVAMLAMAAAYNVVCINLALLHGIPSPPPFLAIPPDAYFFWASFFYTPALLAGWLFAAGFSQVVARALGGTGGFEDTLAALGVATALATLPALLPDLAITFVQVIGWMDYGPWYASVHGGGVWFYIVWAYLLAYLAAFGLLYREAIGAAHRLARGPAWIAAILAFGAYQGFIILHPLKGCRVFDACIGQPGFATLAQELCEDGRRWLKQAGAISGCLRTADSGRSASSTPSPVPSSPSSAPA